MHLIGLKEMSGDKMIALLDAAEEYLDENGAVTTPKHRVDRLSKKTLGLLFLEASPETRVSFELAARRLGAEVVVMGEDDARTTLEESVADTCRALAAMGVDGFVVRHHDRQLPHVLVDKLKVPIVNAGNGSGEHPTQGLLDALTLRRHFGCDQDLSGLKVAIMGDVVNSRVARSDAHAFAKLGAEVLLAGPKMLLPSDDRRNQWPGGVTTSRKEALSWADAVVVLRVHPERIYGNIIDPHEYAMDWGIDSSVEERYLDAKTVIMHPGPVVRGEVLSDPVLDSERCLISKQNAHGVAVRQAVLASFGSGGDLS